MEFLFKGIFIGILVSFPLGPMGLLIVQRTLNKGRLSGFFSGLGAATADTFFALIAGYGISYVVQFIEKQQLYFQIIGGIIIILLGLSIFYSNPVKQLRMKRLNRSRLSQDFFSILFLALSNPLSIFYYIAMFTGINLATGATRFYNLFFIVAGVALGTIFWWFILTTTVNHFRHRFRLRIIWWMNKIAGTIIMLLGAAAILSVWFH